MTHTSILELLRIGLFIVFKNERKNDSFSFNDSSVFRKTMSHNERYDRFLKNDSF